MRQLPRHTYEGRRRARTALGLLAGFICVSLLAPPASPALLYLSTRHGIERVNEDGSALDTNFIPNVGSGALAIDGKHIYWTRGRSIGRADLDGSHVRRNFLHVKARALVVSKGHLYWTNPGIHVIGRARLDGAQVQKQFIANGSDASDLAVHDGHLYWADSFNNAIGRANLNGSHVQVHFIPTGKGTHPRALTVGKGRIYWVNQYRSLGRVRLDGSELEPNFVSGCDTEPGDCPEYSTGIAVDRAHLYWSADLLAPAPDLSRTHAIGRANIDGSGVDHRFLVTARPVESLALWGRSGSLVPRP